jgi:hypothetical protein
VLGDGQGRRQLADDHEQFVGPAGHRRRGGQGAEDAHDRRVRVRVGDLGQQVGWQAQCAQPGAQAGNSGEPFRARSRVLVSGDWGLGRGRPVDRLVGSRLTRTESREYLREAGRGRVGVRNSRVVRKLGGGLAARVRLVVVSDLSEANEDQLIATPPTVAARQCRETGRGTRPGVRVLRLGCGTADITMPSALAPGTGPKTRPTNASVRFARSPLFVPTNSDANAPSVAASPS